MQIIGARFVETLDTKGTDGSNATWAARPPSPATSAASASPTNTRCCGWTSSSHYYTTYGIRQVLNLNPGTVLAGYLLFRLGVNIEFKISVFMGNDNPLSALWTLLGAALFAREDGSTPLVGFNWSNSVDNETIESAAHSGEGLSLEEPVRFEHHITETWKSIVRQPYAVRRTDGGGA